MNETCEIIIYTQNGAVAFDVMATSEDFEERLAAALEQGTVLLDTADGSKLVVSALNVVAVEVKKAERRKESTEYTPPVKNY